MATPEILQEGSNHRYKQLRRLMFVIAALAFVQALITSRIFYHGAHWRSLTLELLKIAVLLFVVLMNLTKVGSEGVRPNLMSIKMATFGLLMSVLTDMALMQMRY